LNHITVDCYTFLAATPDVVIYDSNVGEVFGRRFVMCGKAVPGHVNPGYADSARVLRALHEQGTDTLTVLSERVHEHGAKFIAEVRMNDTHARKIDPENPSCSQFLLDHPQWVIRRSDALPGGLEETALDYSHLQVRQHVLGIIAELAGRPEVDGIEMNFNRWLKFFKREEAPGKAPIMTEFVGRVRDAVLEAGSRRSRDDLILAARVPSTLEECRLCGLDPETWACRGYLDQLIVADWNSSDPQIPTEEFAAFTRPSDCSLLVQMGDMIGGTWQGKPSMHDRGRGLAIAEGSEGYHCLLNSDAEARATADNAYAWGADGISFWNICSIMRDHQTKPGSWGGPAHRERALSWMNAVAGPDTVLAGPRHYHFLPLYKWNDIDSRPRNYAHHEQYHSPGAGRHCQIVTFTPETNGRRCAYDFRMADGRNGERLGGTMRFCIFHVTPQDGVTVHINGTQASPEHVRRDYRPQADPPATWFELALADCPPFRGFNELGITLRPSGHKHEPPYMEELEVIVDKAAD